MPLSDKVIEELRNDTYAGGLVDKGEAEELTDEFKRLTASADQPFGAQRMLAFAVVTEVLAVAIAIFGMSYLRRFVDDGFIAVFGTIFVFSTGFFAAFAAYKLYQEYVNRDANKAVDDGVMSGAEYDRRSDVTIYVTSVAGGFANLVIVIVLLIY
ncbi:MAG: hypothetical protein ABI878_02825 [Acidobacteriota bacterium]